MLVIAPQDAELFSRQSTAMVMASVDDAIGLLGRTLPAGDGNTVFNLDDDADGPARRSWVQARYHDLDAERSSSQVGFGARASSIQVGTDWTMAGTARIGVAVAHDNAWLRDSLGSRGRSDVTRLSLYGSQLVGPVGLSATLGYAHARDEAWRATGIGDARSRRGTDAYTVGVQAALPFTLGGLLVTPVVGVVATQLSGDAFLEQGEIPGVFAIAGKARSETVVTPYASLDLSRTLVSTGGIRWTPEAQLGYRHAGGAQGQRYVLTAGDGTVFDGNRAKVAGDVAQASVALTAQRNGWTLFLRYQGQWANQWNDQQVQLGLRVAY